MDFRACLAARGDELFELADAVLCADGPVRTLAGLSLVAEHRRGHGALYDAVNHGRVAIGRLRRALAGLPLPAWPDGRIRLAVDVCNWLRPDAATSPERLFCHVYGRGKGQAQMIPGWPYSVIAALEPGRTSWTAVLDAIRLGLDDDQTEVTAAQVREVVARLAAAGHWRQGDLPVLVVCDAGYDLTRLAWLLADLGGKRCVPNEAGAHVSSTWRCLWPAGEEGVAEHLKAPCVVLAGRAAEGIDRVTDTDIGEAGVFQHRPPALTGQPASYSTGP